MRSEPRYLTMSPATSPWAAATPSMMVLASRVIGIAAGSMNSTCARHAAASNYPRRLRGRGAGLGGHQCLSWGASASKEEMAGKPPAMTGKKWIDMIGPRHELTGDDHDQNTRSGSGEFWH